MDEHHYTFQALPGPAFQRQEYLESMNLVTETMILFLVDSSAKNYVFAHVVTQASLLTFKPSPYVSDMIITKSIDFDNIEFYPRICQDP